jgi:steroid delta-isomerase-like uncharacterized protein
MGKRVPMCLLGLVLAVVGSVPSVAKAEESKAAGDLGARIQKANDELFHKGNLDMVREMFAPSYVVHLTGADKSGSHEFIRSFVTDLRAAFPDLRVEVEVLIADGDKVAWQRTHRGTFKSDFQGIPATGRSMLWRDMVVTRYENGKIAEEWGVSDFVGRSR